MTSAVIKMLMGRANEDYLKLVEKRKEEEIKLREVVLQRQEEARKREENEHGNTHKHDQS